jgi:selenium metabolism protein YedF
MKTVDARGMLCPRPIIETKKGLNDLQPGEYIKVLIDNETSLGNVCKYLKDNNCHFTQVKESGHWSLTVSSPGSPLSEKPAEDYCEIVTPQMTKGNYVVALTSDIMGQGDEALGRKLMTSFVNILTELDHLPSSVVCYNSGVKLALPESAVVDTLKELEKQGR